VDSQSEGRPPRTLLVVEDNDVAREGLAAVLRHEGYQVLVAANGEEALALVRTGPRPDLILLDLVMPVSDGWSFLNRCLGEGPKPPVPIIVATGTVLTREWVEAMGCQGFLTKPIETAPLLAELRRCLGEP
jgi:CheY-like chemotaxis protein